MMLPKGRRNHICLTGPFETGLLLNSQELIHEGYRSVQDQCLNKAADTEWKANWFAPERSTRENKLAFDVDNYRGIPLTPKYFMGVQFAQNHEIYDELTALAGQIDDSFDLEIDEVKLKFHEWGVGSFTLKGTYQTSTNCSIEEIKSYHERLGSGLPRKANQYIQLFSTEFKRFLPERYFYRSKLSEEINIAWVHRIFYLGLSRIELQDYAHAMPVIIKLPDAGGLKDVSINKGVHFYPSVGSSLVLHDQNESIEEEILFVMERVIEHLNCSWLSASLMEKDLFYQTNAFARESQDMKLRALEQKYESIAELKERIVLFQSVHFNNKLNLSPQEYILWEYIYKIWKLDDLTEGIKEKHDTLEHMNRSILDRVQSKQNNKLNYLVFIFTAISFLIIALQIIDFVQARVNVPNLVRSLIIVVLVLILIFSVRKLKKWLYK